MDIKQDIIKYKNFYLLTPNLFFCKDKSNNTFLLANYTFYSVNKSEGEYSFNAIKNITFKKNYIDYIALDAIEEKNNDSCQIDKNEIILYGKSGKNIDFYLINKGINDSNGIKT